MKHRLPFVPWHVEYAEPVDNLVTGDGGHALRCSCGKSTGFHQLKNGAVVEAMARGWLVERERVSLIISATCDECRRKKVY